MQLVPPALAPAIQAYLMQQGQPMVIDGNGNLDAGGVIALAFNEVEIRTSLTPSLVFPIAPSGQPGNPAMQELVHQLQPTVVFRGPAGTQTIAPYGAAQGAESWLPVIAIGGAIVLGIGWLIFAD